MQRLHSQADSEKLEFRDTPTIQDSSFKRSSIKQVSLKEAKRVVFPEIHDYEMPSLNMRELSRRSVSTASTSITPSDFGKSWGACREYGSKGMNCEVDFSDGKMSQSTRANSFEIFEIDSKGLECGDILCFAPLKNFKVMVFDDSSDEELECEELYNEDFVNSCDKQKQAVDLSDIYIPEAQENFTLYPIKNPYKPVLDESHFNFIENLKETQQYYGADPSYLDSKQPEITEMMRAILVDWMIEASVDFRLKRETLYTAVSYLNRYLSKVSNVPSWKLQLVGVTALVVATKNEEILVPRIYDFAKATDDGYNMEQIKQMEIEMCKVLEWRLNPITLFAVANYVMKCWDKFIENLSREDSYCFAAEISEVSFKQPNIKSCLKFREVIQVLDLLLLNNQTLQYDIMDLVISVIYFVLGQASQIITRAEIVNYNSSLKPFLKNDAREFNKIFIQFLKEHSFSAIESLTPSFQYISPYFEVSFSFEPPSAIKENSKIEYKGHYEDFLSSQTHSPANLPFIKGMLERKH